MWTKIRPYVGFSALALLSPFTKLFYVFVVKTEENLCLLHVT